MLRFRVYWISSCLLVLATIAWFHTLAMEAEKLEWVRVDAYLIDPSVEIVSRGLGTAWRIRSDLAWTYEGRRYTRERHHRHHRHQRLYRQRWHAEDAARQGVVPVWIDPVAPHWMVDKRPDEEALFIHGFATLLLLLLTVGTLWRGIAARRWQLRSARWSPTESPAGDLMTYETRRGTWVGASIEQLRGFFRSTALVMGSVVLLPGILLSIAPPYEAEYLVIPALMLLAGVYLNWRFLRGLFRSRVLFVDGDQVRLEHSVFGPTKVQTLARGDITGVRVERSGHKTWCVSIVPIDGGEAAEVVAYQGDNRQSADWLTDQLRDWAGIRVERRRTHGPPPAQLPGARWTLSRDSTLRRVGSASNWRRR